MSEIKKYRYLFALILTVLIFCLGILASNLADDKRQADLQSTLEDDTTDIQSKQLLIRYLDEKNSCELRQEGLAEIIDGYNNRLERVQSYEQQSFFQESEFRSIRRNYVLSGIEYWMFAEQTDENCEDYNPNTILFFTKDDCNECDRQGDLLSDIKRVHGEDVLVFSVYTDLDDSMINLLRDEYDVQDTPTMVINKNTTIRGFASRENVTQHLELNEEQ